MDRKIGLEYGACESSTDENAKRITYLIGPDGKITHAFDKVNAAKHPEEILTML